MPNELNLDAPGVADKIARNILADIDQSCYQLYPNENRKHLGASVIGEPCYRKLWFIFRWAKKPTFDARMLRLFNRGHREEVRFIEWLRAAGYTVRDLDPATGKQWRVDAIGGHFGGSQDGECLLPEKYQYTEPLLLEFKTSGTGAGFNKLGTQGVKFSKPQHSDQMDTYGTIKKYQFGLYLAVNKNDDSIHCEIVKLDWERGIHLQNKARVIILSQVAPPRIAENRSSDKCKYCDVQDVCYFEQPLEKNCRSCKNASARDNKEWFCEKWNATIPEAAIEAGCADWHSIYRA